MKLEPFETRIVLDSVSEAGKRITTLATRMPRCILAEANTHRVFSRNSRSSRAVPVKKLIQEVIDNPYIPVKWGKNQKGMQAGEECDELIKYGEQSFKTGDKQYFVPITYTNEDGWLHGRDLMVELATAFSEAGYHKQIVNRLLEPWAWVDTLITSTEWDNFFGLRCHPDADPAMEKTAESIYQAYSKSTPKLLKYGEWHLPFISEEDWDICHKYSDGLFEAQELEHYRPSIYQSEDNLVKKLSVARCARISYKPFDGNDSIEAELDRYDLLVGSSPVHASPAEHQATPDHYIQDVGEWAHPKLHGNFVGYIQYRKTLPNEVITKYTR